MTYQTVAGFRTVETFAGVSFHMTEGVPNPWNVFRKAIVDDISGVTRDRQYGVAEWNEKSFNVIDTGGFVQGSEDVFEKEIAKQVLVAVDEANVILFMVDAATGI